MPSPWRTRHDRARPRASSAAVLGRLAKKERTRDAKGDPERSTSNHAGVPQSWAARTSAGMTAAGLRRVDASVHRPLAFPPAALTVGRFPGRPDLGKRIRPILQRVLRKLEDQEAKEKADAEADTTAENGEAESASNSEAETHAATASEQTTA